MLQTAFRMGIKIYLYLPNRGKSFMTSKLYINQLILDWFFQSKESLKQCEQLSTYWHRVRLRITVQFSSVQSFSCVPLFVPPWTTAHQASLTPIADSNLCLSSQGCHSTISFSVVPFSSCLQSFPASRSFPMTQFFTSGDQSSGVSASPMNIQDWFPMNQSFQWIFRTDFL